MRGVVLEPRRIRVSSGNHGPGAVFSILQFSASEVSMASPRPTCSCMQRADGRSAATCIVSRRFTGWCDSRATGGHGSYWFVGGSHRRRPLGEQLIQAGARAVVPTCDICKSTGRRTARRGSYAARYC
jgi:hypothetical protein